MRAVVGFGVWLVLLSSSGSVMAGSVPRYTSAASQYSADKSFSYGFGWYKSFSPATAADLRDPISGRAYTVEVDPAIDLNFSDSSVQLHRKGLRYLGAEDAWSIGIKYRRLKLASDAEVYADEHKDRPKVLQLEWSVEFD